MITKSLGFHLHISALGTISILAAAAVELEAVTVSLLGDAHVGEGDILDLDNGLLREGGQRRKLVC